MTAGIRNCTSHDRRRNVAAARARSGLRTALVIFGLVALTSSGTPLVPPANRAAHAETAPRHEPDLGLISASTLAPVRERWIVLDARPGAAYRDGHLAGALSFSWEDHTSTDPDGVRYQPGPPESIAQTLGELGISASSPIVVYGDAAESWGGEGWACWLLAWIGHEGPIRLIDGGIEAWQAAGLPLTTDPPAARPPVDYAVSLRPELDIDTNNLRHPSQPFTVIDTRSNAEWMAGRIPGAVHIPWDRFSTGADHRPLEPAALHELLAEHGVPLDRPVVYYCTGGIRSAYCWLVHQLSDLPDARNYEGGIEAWDKLQ
ncbi:MAG: sulfurtransferase [Candidatus Eisenbacteria bacterium]|nr:sulfurtransferase [Candidatus Eisenbacteria bacterium]